jgi:type IV secretory pathway VirB6-like protein
MADERRKRPQSELEIIPPGQQSDSGVWVSETGREAYRIYIRKLRPFEIVLWAVMVGAILTVIVVLLLGFFLIAIPVMTALIAIAVVSVIVRGYFHRQ